MADCDEKLASSTTERKTGFSFGFTKKIEQKNISLLRSITSDEKPEHENDTEFITSVDEKVISRPNGVAPSDKLSIPMIKNNNWRNSVSGTCSDLDIQAANEIIAEAKADNESEAVIKKKKESLAIPLLIKNAPPVGYETDEKLDVSIRPDEAEEADYEKIPIEAYGLAMLRGMGWKDGEGIGKDKMIVPTIDAVLRPKGLGLGADKSQMLQDKYKDGKKQNENNKDNLEMKKGAFCSITNGPHSGLYSQIQGMDEDNARVVVKMALGGQLVTLSQFAVKLVTDKEYAGSSHVINKAKVDRYKEKESQSSGHRTESSDSGRLSHREHSSERRKKRRQSRSPRKSEKYKSQKYHKSRDSDEDQTYGAEKNTSDRVVSGVLPWLKSQLRVRIIDQSYHKGRYYNTKVVVVDVMTPTTCCCRTDDGRLLEGISQDMLETVVPRGNPAYIQFTAGKHKGQTGEVIRRDKQSSLAVVQLLSDRSELVTAKFDDICEYAGNIDDDVDY